ncbi:hypothetical protein YC2023_005711 [Brassica napus]
MACPGEGLPPGLVRDMFHSSRWRSHEGYGPGYAHERGGSIHTRVITLVFPHHSRPRLRPLSIASGSGPSGGMMLIMI